MVIYQKDVSLQFFNTFGVDVKTKYFSTFESLGHLRQILSINIFQLLPKLVLGEGSNILFTKNFRGLILKNEIKGYKIIKENEETIKIEVGGGENWHQLVFYCVEKNWGGIENLSLIPGTVGAAPIQNIGAYGVEFKDVFSSLLWYDFAKNDTKVFNLNQCKFGYRSSIFKNEFKGRGVILSVTLQLNKKPKLNITYEAITKVLKKNRTRDLDIKMVSKAVIKIRKKKLPDPKLLGNCGSFFKNPEICYTTFKQLKNHFDDIQAYPQTSGRIKIFAGWLIEQCGLKSYTQKHVSIYKKHALVIINKGGATGKDIKNFAEEIQKKVLKKFNIHLVPEVNIL